MDKLRNSSRNIVESWNQIWDNASGRKKKYIYFLVYTFLFLVVYWFAYSAFREKGKSYVWDVDGIKQHYAAFVYLGRYFREIVTNFLSGNFTIPMFDFSVGMGEDIITTFNFYGLGDPFLLLSGLVPSAWSETAYNFLAIFRIYLAGIAFSALCFYLKKDYYSTLVGAFVYSFCGFVLHAGVKHPFFIIPMIYLPILMIGIDKIIKKERPHLFIVTTFIAALNGFYFLYMATIFIVIFAVIRVLALYKKSKIKELIRAGLRSVTAYITGLSMAAVIFLPSVVGYLASSRSTPVDSSRSLLYYDFEHYKDMFARLFAPPILTWQFLGVAAISFLAVILLFQKANKKYIQLRVGFLIACAFMLIPFGGYMLNGFGYISGRWLFMFSLIISLIVTYMVPQLLNLNRRSRNICMAAVVIYVLICFSSKDMTELYPMIGLVMLAVTTLILCGLNISRRGMQLSCILIVCMNLIINADILFTTGEYAEAFIDKNNAFETVSNTQTQSAPLPQEDEFYRVDSVEASIENADIITNRYGVSSYFSISNANRLQYLFELENADILDTSFMIKGNDNRTFMLGLASSKYFVADKSQDGYVPFGYELTDVKNRADETDLIYENKYALPLGYTYTSYITTEEYNKLGAVKKQEALLQSIVLEEETEYNHGVLNFTSEKIDYNIEPNEDILMENGQLIIKENNAKLKINFNNIQNKEVYLRLKGLDISSDEYNNFIVKIECKEISKSLSVVSDRWNWYFGRENYLTNLGYYEDGIDSCTIIFPKKGNFQLKGIEIYAQSMDNYPKQIAMLKSDSLENIVISDNKVEGTIDLSENKLLLLSIPYSTGWSAQVDGEEAELLKANTMYMALDLKEGSHTITLNYCTPYIKEGLIISIIGMLVFIGYIIYYDRSKGHAFHACMKKHNFGTRKT